MQTLPYRLMRANSSEVVTLAHDSLPATAEEPAQHSYHTIIAPNARIVRFPDRLQQVASLIRCHGFGSDVTLAHEPLTQFCNGVVVNSMVAFWTIPIVAPCCALTV